MLNREASIKRCQEFFNNAVVCDRVLNMLSCISNQSRIRILCLLREGEFNVGEIISAVGGKPSNISQQIKILSLAGYIKGRRQEKNIYYSLVDETIHGVINYLEKVYKE